MKNNLFIFDCFGVLVSEVASVWFSKKVSGVQADYLKNKFFARADNGDITFYELVAQIADHFNIESDKLLEEWDNLTIRNEELIEYLKKISAKTTLAMLSNTPKGLMERIFTDNELKMFDRIFLSCDQKISKPSIKFYKLLIDSFECAFDKLYMIDDNIINLGGLACLNITPVLYERNAQIKCLMEENI